VGDRTSVTLTVLTSQKAEAEKICMAAGYEADHMSQEMDGSLTYFSFYEVNYGDLQCLNALTDAGIAHDSNWDNGSEFTAGCEFMRFTSNGETKGFSYSDEYFNPDLSRCMGLIDKPDELRAFILDHHDKVTALPWDHQEEFGKIYRTKNLISS
jgi:hypothetical protein